MARYVTMKATPRAYHWLDEDEPHRPYLEVDGSGPVDTGLVSEAGEPIMRLPNPIGFGRDGEW